MTVHDRDTDAPVNTCTPAPPPPADRPARFERWPDDITTRAYELWSTVAARSAPRTEHLLAQESGAGVAVPAASTIRAWAAQEGWASRADADLATTRGRSRHELQIGFLAAVSLAQQTLLDAMCGLLDEAPYGGASRIKSAEIVLRLAERAEVPFLGDDLPAFDPEETKSLSLAERSRRLMALREAENRRFG